MRYVDADKLIEQFGQYSSEHMTEWENNIADSNNVWSAAIATVEKSLYC